MNKIKIKKRKKIGPLGQVWRYTSAPALEAEARRSRGSRLAEAI
jgi:hypothetical protein